MDTIYDKDIQDKVRSAIAAGADPTEAYKRGQVQQVLRAVRPPKVAAETPLTLAEEMAQLQKSGVFGNPQAQPTGQAAQSTTQAAPSITDLWGQSPSGDPQASLDAALKLFGSGGVTQGAGLGGQVSSYAPNAVLQALDISNQQRLGGIGNSGFLNGLGQLGNTSNTIKKSSW